MLMIWIDSSTIYSPYGTMPNCPGALLSLTMGIWHILLCEVDKSKLIPTFWGYPDVISVH